MEASQSHRIAREPSGGRFVVALLLFATSAVIAVLLLLTALVVWLSALTGSFIASTRSGYEWLVEKAAFLFRLEQALRTKE